MEVSLSAVLDSSVTVLWSGMYKVFNSASDRTSVSIV
jgi:hypothetical protein